MKKHSIVYFTWSVIFIAGLFSCVSTDNSAPRSLTVVDNASSAVPADNPMPDVTDTPAAQAVIVPVIEQADPCELWILKAGKTPDAAVKGNAFKSAFSATVTDSQTQLPVEGAAVTVSYPSASADDIVSFAETELTTDAKGTVSFAAAVPSFSCRSEITFSIGSGGHTKSVSIPYRVKTNLQRSGGTISILDYTKNGRPIRDNSLSASAVLTSFMKNGFTGIGLADFIDEIDSGNPNAVYEAARRLIGSASSFFVFGTVKYDGDIRKTDSGYEVPLIADITCLDMKTGSHLYAAEVRVTGTGKSEWAALNSARNDQLAPQIAERIIYGM